MPYEVGKGDMLTRDLHIKRQERAVLEGAYCSQADNQEEGRSSCITPEYHLGHLRLQADDLQGFNVPAAATVSLPKGRLVANVRWASANPLLKYR